MNMQDKWISISIAIVIVMHFAVWIIGYSTNKLSYLISILNLAIGAGTLAYWIINQLRIHQHIIELREVVILIFEMIVAASALYNIVYAGHYKSLKIFQYVFLELI